MADLEDQVRRSATFYAGPGGHVVAQLLAAGVTRRGGAEDVRSLFFRRRGADTVRLIQDAQAAGQLKTGLDAGIVIDLLFGPIVFRLFNGLPPLRAGEAGELAKLALQALAPH